MKGKDYTKAVDSGKLWTEIKAAFDDLIDVHTYIENEIDKVHVHFEEDKDGAEWATIDSLVTAHIPITLADLKKKKNALVDERTKELIYAGYVHDGETFSLSIHAQRNWIAISTSFEANVTITRKATPSLTFEQAYDGVDAVLFASPGMAVSTLDDKEYLFSSYADYMTFFNDAYDFVNSHYLSGRALKDQINNAVDEAALVAIVDNR